MAGDKENNPIAKAIFDAMEWDTDIIPFPSDKNDWALWVHQKTGRWMYIEHALIQQVTDSTGQDRHDVFIGIGHKILKCLNNNELQEGTGYAGCFSNLPTVGLEFAMFSGRIFVFQPRNSTPPNMN
jgi:hypothetical protein